MVIEDIIRSNDVIKEIVKASASTNMIKSNKKGNTKSFTNKPWFDKQCLDLKKTFE